ncbi:MAG: PD40 domain-containing protein [candidate division Zixibacteria bacterium]|nr:PD40 domain-containing protein [candidate division Zixibacteria bacterium]
MKRLIPIAVVLLAMFAGNVLAQETYFGKNKVRYKDFDWKYIQTRHFDIHFYEDAYEIAEFAAAVMESSYAEISEELNYHIQQRAPLFIYNSQNDLQQTNIISMLIPEGLGGVTEASKKRMVVHFNGSYEDLRHVMHHELTHGVIFDMLYGNLLTSLISTRRLFSPPLWFAEGYAEYSSRHGWDSFSDMFVRDATINNYLQPPWAIRGFAAYKQGQAMIKFIADKYGEKKIGDILYKGKRYLTLNKAMKESIGIDLKEFWKEFSKEMKKRYWPDIVTRKEVDEISEKLTSSREDGSYFNEKPVFSPDGEHIAIFTDRWDYPEIVLISAENGKVVKRMVKGSKSADLESLHSYVSGMSFSPDGSDMVFVAKSKGEDALMFYNLKKGKIFKRRKFKFHNIRSPEWSPDGKKIAFTALRVLQRDVYIYDMESDEISQLTNDRFDDLDPTWAKDSRSLIFSSDRPHPTNPDIDSLAEAHVYTHHEVLMPGGFQYGFYNLFSLDIDTEALEHLSVGKGQNKAPMISPDGSKLAFISSRNGIDNLYIAYLDSAGTEGELKNFAITDILTGISSVSWSPSGRKLVFEAFHNGAFDIFLMKEIIPVGEEGVIELTAFAKSEYDLLKSVMSVDASAESSDSVKAADTTVHSEIVSLTDDYAQYEVEEDSLVSDSTARADSTAREKVITETGIHDDEFVFVGDNKKDPLDTLMFDIPEEDDIIRPLKEPKEFDKIKVPAPGEDFEIRKYKTKFTPDYIGGGIGYDTFFGLRGQTFFVFSDYLGNHQIFIATDLVNTIDQSNIQAFYLYNRKRTSVGAGFFHTKNFYLDPDNRLFSDRFYGFQFYARRPFSVFSRVEFTASQFFIDRQYYDLGSPPDRSSKVSTGEISWIFDNIVWGITGPLNGRRLRLDFEASVNLFNSGDIEFYATEFDYRKYWHFGSGYSFAFRMSGAASFGSTPKHYFLGGTTNWIGNRTLDARVYEVENLYFADVVTPLRGVPYYEISGDRYGLVNLEFRFPMIDYFAMRFPLRMTIARVQGAMFFDIGSAWFGSNFKGGTSQGGNSRLKDLRSGFGFGMRANLGFLLLRYDLAWSTDFSSVAPHTTSYFSFGADF